MAIKRTREIDTCTDDGQRWPIYEYVDIDTGEVIYRTPAGPLVKNMDDKPPWPRKGR